MEQLTLFNLEGSDMKQTKPAVAVDKNGVVYKTVEQLSRKLDAMGMKYKIILPDGQELGELEVSQKHHKRKSSSLPYGTYSAIYKHVLPGLPIGGVAEFDTVQHKLDPTRFMGALSAAGRNLWGNGSNTVAYNHKSKCVEILRLI